MSSWVPVGLVLVIRVSANVYCYVLRKEQMMQLVSSCAATSAGPERNQQKIQNSPGIFLLGCQQHTLILDNTRRNWGCFRLKKEFLEFAVSTYCRAPTLLSLVADKSCSQWNFNFSQVVPRSAKKACAMPDLFTGRFYSSVNRML